MAIPISRFASVIGDIAKAQGDGKAFSSLPGQCEELERRSDKAEGKGFDDYRQAADRRARTSSAKFACAGFGRNLRLFSGLFTIPAQKFVIALIDSSRSHP
ncbi:hypothetical protein J3P71_05275 [Rhizobium leguminosarum]|uniref:hypothetical protein n=1 Tax=Rhizobium leguminosarum TaxID=384 RepID=UPI0014423F06|nr:hypothetical protein [Rhizobium leguminosarum]MBY5836675.1 hypothetical protein [Rhizobium leguminosarum]NKM81750.1 hypothetical protein [Rhizobium leguminosarum bv. viciae]QSZ09192.1 hypothetical protein J3P71_05275 [Rhizobium leguminosarum]